MTSTIPSPAVVSDDVVDDRTSARLRAALIGHREAFVPGTTTRGTAGVRRALVLDDRHLGPLLDPVAETMIDRMSSAAGAFGVDAGALTRFEVLVLATVDGGRYPPHVDRTGTGPASGRQLSAVLFCQDRPPGFGGGELVVGAGPNACHIAPVDARLAVFRSDELHEVRPVQVTTDRFEDSRFSFAGFAS